MSCIVLIWHIHTAQNIPKKWVKTKKRPTTTRKHKRHERRKIKRCQISVSISGADVKDISKTVGSGVRQALPPCSYTQGMTWKFQEGTLLCFKSPRACMSHCGSHGANIKRLLIQHFTWYAPQMQPIYSCPHQLQRLWLKKEMQMLIFHNPVSCTYALQINTWIQH